MQSHRRKTAEQPLTAGRRRAFTAITALFPVAFFVILEVGFRLFDYGPDISLFVTEEIAGRTYSIMNPDVKHRYFSRVEFSPNTSPDYFLIPKPENTFRIFCLGGSTTVGFPYGYVGSFSTYLRDRLGGVFADRNIEVINLGMTATNSFTVVDIARDINVAQPDLLIVYDGQNEFYGALGIASRESLGNIRWVTKTYLRLVHLKTFVFLRDVFTAASGIFGNASPPEPGGTMMERLAKGQYIPYRSKTYNDALNIFRANLAELKSIAEQLDVPLILSSQVSNLRRQAPFISDPSAEEADKENAPTPSSQGRLDFNAVFNRGFTEFLEGRIDSALVHFQRAREVDSLRADVYFQIARCLDTLGRNAEARRSYILARDYDELRFRTSTDFNREILATEDAQRSFVVDMESKFQQNSPDSLIGNELILEHLHPNSRGYFLMAREYARRMREHGLIAPTHEWESRDTLSDGYFWERRRMTELDELCAQRRVNILTSGWPFKPQSATVPEVSSLDTIRQIVEQMVGARLTWEQGHVAAAEYYERHGDHDRAAKEYLALIAQMPVNVSAYLRLGQLYVNQSKLDEARDVLKASLGIERTAYANRILGSLLLDGGSPTEAIPYLEQAFALSNGANEKCENGYVLALALARSGSSPRAAATLQQVLGINPRYKPARDLLNRIEVR